METEFSDKMVKEFLDDGLSEEEIELLEDALTEAQTIEMLPDDISALVKKIDEKLPNDAKQSFVEFLKLSETEPELFKQFLALQFVMANEANKEPQKEVKATIITNLSDEEYERASKNYFSTLAHLSAEKRKEFLKLIENITDEQKQELVKRLLEK